MRHLDSWRASTGCPQARGNTMGRDALALAVLADAVLEQVRNASADISEADLLVSLPAYLDATDIRLLQMEVNRRSLAHVELQHRPGERRVGVRLIALGFRR